MTKRPGWVVIHLRAIQTEAAGKPTDAFHSGVITSDKGHDSGISAEVNSLPGKNPEIFPN
jgi:hypothetical protein